MRPTTHSIRTKENKTIHKLPAFTARPERTIEWIGGVNYQNLERILGELKRLYIEDKKDEIHLMVNSFGGITGVGMNFFDAATSWLKLNLVTIGSGDVDSSGIIVFLAGKRRYITKNTTLLFHLAGRTFGTEKRFTTVDLEVMLNEDRLKDYQYACVVSDATSGRYTPNDILELMKNDTMLTAEEVVNMGLAHRVLA